MTTNNVAYGAFTSMTITNLESLANSITAGWQSARVDNQTSVKALDYEIVIKLPTANTAPANDKCVYVYISEAITTDGGATWRHDDVGTATGPTGSEGTITVLSNVTGSMSSKQLGTIPYYTQNMTLQKVFKLSNVCGQFMPDGFSIIIVNYTGAALATGCVVGYRAITETNA